MELLVKEMQDPEAGVPVRSQKLFLTSIPSAFMGELFYYKFAHSTNLLAMCFFFSSPSNRVRVT